LFNLWRNYFWIFYLKDEETTTAINESNGTNVEINLLLTSKTKFFYLFNIQQYMGE